MVMGLRPLKEFIALTTQPASRWQVAALIALMILPLPLYIWLPIFIVVFLMPYLLKHLDAEHDQMEGREARSERH